MWRRDEPSSAGGLVVAHRGGAALANGDPVEGVRKLVAQGVPMVEFDVRATKDGVLVVQHDQQAYGLRLAEHSYSDLADAGSPLPLLADLLDVAGDQIALDVELKEAGYEKVVVEAVLEQASPEKVVFTSFNDGVAAAVAAQGADVGVGLILGRIQGLSTPLLALNDAFPFRRLAACGGDFLVPSRALLATGLARRAARRGIGLLIWHVSDPAEIARLRSAPGVLGVITDSVPRVTAFEGYPPEELGKRRLPK